MRAALYFFGLSALLLVFLLTAHFQHNYEWLKDCPDLNQYRTATDKFFKGANPYAVNTFLVPGENGEPTIECPLNIWNPPPIFLVLGLPSLLDLKHLVLFWPIVGALAALTLALLGWRLAGNPSRIPLSHASIFTVAAYPVWIEFFSGQNTSILAAIFFLGCYLILQRRFFCGGFLASIAILKPHIFLLPGILLAAWIIKNRRYSVVFGALTALLISTAICELINPGIFSAWLNRPYWPMRIQGSTLFSLVRAIFGYYGLGDPKALSWIIPTIGVVIIGAVFKTSLFNLEPRFLAFAASLTPVLAPYGFCTDQVPLIFAQAFYLGVAHNRSEREEKIIAIVLVLISLLSFWTSRVQILGGPILSWYTYPCLTLALICYLEARGRFLARS